ncbi:hypothetical protein WUBG_09245 [Wuchereria bancrofti]|uniref:C2H2-type domain-containing protein n=1 Tax=Wuchereria bancrofti TaxID=6293 RepID=J9AZ03_WUCBA|nr:hypothetical protein WUBG_09245 [Wuchereria bancrofti]
MSASYTDLRYLHLILQDIAPNSLPDTSDTFVKMCKFPSKKSKKAYLKQSMIPAELSFSSASSFSSHQQTHQPQLECEDCDQFFTCENNRNIHKKR